MADGLLNKASIILTPTGYKAGTLYNVAPVVEPYEDFDFARASVASRVNSSGLVEMVGRTLSSELVTNGDFATDIDGWNAKGSTIIWDSGKLKADNSSGNSSGGAWQNINLDDSKQYKITMTMQLLSGDGNGTFGLITSTNFGSGQSIVYEGQTLINGGSSVTETFYFTPASGDVSIQPFVGQSNAIFTIDNVSVKEIIDTNNIPRISYDSNGDNGHILLEPTSTNLITYSEDFSQTVWTKNDVLIEGGYTAPDGSNTAYKVTNNGSNAHLVGFINQNTSRHKSIWAKTVSGIGSAYLLNQTGNNLFTLTNEWQRFDATHSGADFFYAVDLRGSQLTEVILWGAQLEELPYATSYIPTLMGSTETRATETATGAGSADLINSTEGVLYAEIAALDDDSDIKGISLGQSGTNVTTNGVTFYFFDNNLRARAYDSDYTLNGGIYFEATKTSINTNTFYKVAISWDSNGGKMYVDGALITPTRNLSGYGFAANYFNSLNFYRNSNDVFEGKCKALAVFNEALSDSELTQLTT